MLFPCQMSEQDYAIQRLQSYTMSFNIGPDETNLRYRQEKRAVDLAGRSDKSFVRQHSGQKNHVLSSFLVGSELHGQSYVLYH